MEQANPVFDITGRGEVSNCDQCPLDQGIDDTAACEAWWGRSGERVTICPNADSYADAVVLANRIKGGE